MSSLRTRLLMVFGFLLLVVVVMPVGLLADDDDDDDGDRKRSPVGSYIFSFLGLPPPATVPGLVTLSSDGTLISVTGSDFAGPSSVFLVKNSAVHGVWSQKKQDVSARALYLNFHPLTGEVVSITRLRIQAKFDKSFDNITGSFFMSVFACPTFSSCPDPLTAAPTIPEPAQGLPFTAKRIQ